MVLIIILLIGYDREVKKLITSCPTRPITQTAVATPKVTRAGTKDDDQAEI